MLSSPTSRLKVLPSSMCQSVQQRTLDIKRPPLSTPLSKSSGIVLSRPLSGPKTSPRVCKKRTCYYPSTAPLCQRPDITVEFKGGVGNRNVQHLQVLQRVKFCQPWNVSPDTSCANEDSGLIITSQIPPVCQRRRINAKVSCDRLTSSVVEELSVWPCHTGSRLLSGQY